MPSPCQPIGPDVIAAYRLAAGVTNAARAVRCAAGPNPDPELLCDMVAGLVASVAVAMEQPQDFAQQAGSRILACLTGPFAVPDYRQITDPPEPTQ